MCIDYDLFPMASDLVPSVEAAELLGIDRSTLSRLVQFGTLVPALRLPGETGAMLFNRSDVLELAAVRERNRAARAGGDAA